MFMGPLEATKPWSTTGVEGVSRFLARVWRSITDEQADEIRLHPGVQNVEPTPEQNRLLHKTIQAVTQDIENLSFNTAISRLMEFNKRPIGHCGTAGLATIDSSTHTMEGAYPQLMTLAEVPN
jgi:leucyl-tRNA synthetase